MVKFLYAWLALLQHIYCVHSLVDPNNMGKNSIGPRA